mgnify:CR=1 FL=1
MQRQETRSWLNTTAKSTQHSDKETVTSTWFLFYQHNLPVQSKYRNSSRSGAVTSSSTPPLQAPTAQLAAGESSVVSFVGSCSVLTGSAGSAEGGARAAAVASRLVMHSRNCAHATPDLNLCTHPIRTDMSHDGAILLLFFVLSYCMEVQVPTRGSSIPSFTQ